MSVRQRGPKHYEVVVYIGRDPATGKQRQVSRTVRGTLKAARAKQDELSAKYCQTDTDLTFEDLAARWLAVARHEESTRYQTQRYLERHVIPRLGHVRASDIRPADLDRFYLELEAGANGRRALAPGTVVRIHGIIAAALEQAVRWGWIATNPARRARPPELDSSDPDVPEIEQVVALLAHARRHEDTRDLYAFLRVSAATGMRRGEVCALRWSDIDLTAGVARKQRAIGQGAGAAYEKDTKTGARHGVALDRGTLAVLRWHHWRAATNARALDTNVRADGYVFSWEPDGSRPWRPGNVSRQFARLRSAADVDEAVQLRMLRHFVATQLLVAGHDVKTVSGRLGHARASTTLNRYSGWVPPSDRDAASTMAKVLAG